MHASSPLLSNWSLTESKSEVGKCREAHRGKRLHHMATTSWKKGVYLSPGEKVMAAGDAGRGRQRSASTILQLYSHRAPMGPRTCHDKEKREPGL